MKFSKLIPTQRYSTEQRRKIDALVRADEVSEREKISGRIQIGPEA